MPTTTTHCGPGRSGPLGATHSCLLSSRSAACEPPAAADDDAADEDARGPIRDWGCLMAVGDLDANQATPAAMVRDRLEVLLDDPSLDAPTREYFEAVRDRLDDADLDDDNRTGTSLCGVPCDIPHDDEPSPASRRGGSRGSTQ